MASSCNVISEPSAGHGARQLHIGTLREPEPRPELVLDSTKICPKKTVVVDVGCVEKPMEKP